MWLVLPLGVEGSTSLGVHQLLVYQAVILPGMVVLVLALWEWFAESLVGMSLEGTSVGCQIGTLYVGNELPEETVPLGVETEP